MGDLVRFTGSTGTIGGGAFSLDDVTDGPGIDALTYADDASGNDPISDETAWILSGFTHATLVGCNADAIQAAISYFEGA